MRRLEKLKICLLVVTIVLAVMTQDQATAPIPMEWPTEIKALDMRAPQWSPAG